MIETPITLILGAGASAPYGYPVGRGLKKKIISSLHEMIKNDNGWVKEFGCPKDLIFDFAYKFQISKAPSIDSFLERNKENVNFTKIGKIAILDIISQSESESRLFKEEEDYDIMEIYEIDDWYTYLVEKLYGPNIDEIFENIRVISYNYDRSLEAFLINPLEGYDRISSFKDAVSIMKKFQIVHMYGRLDNLPWEGNWRMGREYGDKIETDTLFDLSEEIKLIHETKELNTIDKANNFIDESKKVYFLGLDLHNNRSNIEDLLDTSLLEDKRILATAYGLEDEEIGTIERFFKGIQGFNYPANPYYTVSNKKSLQAMKTHQPL